MLIVLLIVGVVVTVLGWYVSQQLYEDCGYIALIIGVVVLIGTIIGFGVNGSSLIEGRYLDAKIAMYAEENELIEQKIADSINAYLAYESGIMEALKVDAKTSISIIAAYPELNGSDLVSKQINIYNSNNTKIKSLKEQKMSLVVNRWWVYFGK